MRISNVTLTKFNVNKCDFINFACVLHDTFKILTKMISFHKCYTDGILQVIYCLEEFLCEFLNCDFKF
uniref:Uncharacterized protein n=2 Tax=Amphiprion TaxID=80969 RepID=A0A3Q1AY96_AMPOC